MKRLILMLSGIFLLTGCGSIPAYTDPEEVSFSLEGEIANQDEAEAALKVIEENLAFAEAEDMDGYLSTILNQAHKETEKELAPFFESYDMQHTLLRAEVIDQQPDRILIQTEQQTIMLAAVEGAEKYRNHIAEANHTLIKEDNRWKIEETIMTDTTFID